MERIILKNALIADAFVSTKADVAIQGGLISQVASNITPLEKDTICDLEGLCILPGFIDIHAHLRTPGQTHKETFQTGLSAALKGGFTTVCGMANTSPVVDNARLAAINNNDANSLGLAKYIQVGAIGMGLQDKEQVDLDALLPETKVFSNDGLNINSSSFMAHALEESYKRSFLLCAHCEPEAEIIKRDLGLLAETKGNYHICHVSLESSIALVKAAKDAGLVFTVEAAPHHVGSYGMDYAVNPPIGSKADMDSVINAIKGGYIDVLATDHAPHTQEDKDAGVSGINGFETAFGMYWKAFCENGIPLEQYSRMSSFTPAKLLGLSNTGLVQEGYIADLAICDLNKEWIVDSSTFVSKSRNTPFNGWQLHGQIVMAFVEGVLKYDNRHIV
ncbi:MAG: dihydroorotase [Eubacteriaceae bacterium]|nr:dihydroorotase [Eubacteriaceae bacterium]